MNDQLLHPETARLEDFARGCLDLSEIEEIQRHLVTCPACRSVLDNVQDDHLLAMVRRAGEGSPALSSARCPAETSLTATDDTGGEQSGRETDDLDSRLPRQLAEHPRYEVVGQIGRGGMGEVYKAVHRLMGRTVALKVINRQLFDDREAVERFRREVRAAAALTHSNVVAAYDAEQAGEVHLLAMEYVEGTNLAEVVKTRGPLPVAKACDYIRQAAEGLDHAHRREMVHRDIKPQNLMLTDEETVKVLDFGLATLTTTSIPNDPSTEGRRDLTSVGAIVGTPDYISPEQTVDAGSVDIRSDIYSLGATFFFLLTGRPPFDKESVTEILRCHADLEAERVDTVRPDIPEELADIIARMLAKDPSRRFQAPIEVADRLSPWVDGWLAPQVRSAIRWAARTRLNGWAFLLLCATMASVVPIVWRSQRFLALVALVSLLAAVTPVALGMLLGHFERPRRHRSGRSTNPHSERDDMASLLEKDRLGQATEVVRWLGVYPAALLAGVSSTYLWQWTSWPFYYLGETAYVVAGAAMAPRFRTATAGVLATVLLVRQLWVYMVVMQTTPSLDVAFDWLKAMCGVVLIYFIQRMRGGSTTQAGASASPRRLVTTLAIVCFVIGVFFVHRWRMHERRAFFAERQNNPYLKDSECEGALRSMTFRLQTYHEEAGEYPTKEQFEQRLLGFVRVDPWENSYQYERLSPHKFKFWSIGPDGKDATGDESTLTQVFGSDYVMDSLGRRRSLERLERLQAQSGEGTRNLPGEQRVPRVSREAR